MLHSRALATCLLVLCLGSPVTAQAVATQGHAPAPAAAPTVHVEGPHVMLGGETVTVLWSSGDERHEVTLDAGEVIDVPSWRGTPAMTRVPLAPPTVGPSVVDAPERIMVVGDVHGRYEPFEALLRHAGVIDDHDRWSFGRNHLVCCGDLMDRGADVARTLWLLHRLEREAAAAGGAVHVLLGNHELMVVQNDLRYLHPDLEGVAEVIGIPYPSLYGKDTVLGRWLRTRHSIVRIGEFAFVHGGISPSLLRLAEARGLDHDDVNRLIRDHLDDPRRVIAADPQLSVLLGSNGPFWHRGYFIEDQVQYDPASDADIDRALAWIGARAIVVGHTQFDRVGSHREGRVIASDVHLERTPEGVLIEGGTPRRIAVGSAAAPLEPLPIEGGS